MIGHTKGCAGIASLIKVALSLHHKVLPPTLGVNKPTAAELWEGDSPAYLNTELRPWVGSDHPRRAAVSSFGFGGTNFHAVLEEHRPQEPTGPGFPTALLPAELFCFAGQVARRAAPGRRGDPPGRRGAGRASRSRPAGLPVAPRPRPDGEGLRLSVVAESVPDLPASWSRLSPGWRRDPARSWIPRGSISRPRRLARSGKTALVFPGQGSQRVDMLQAT